MSEETLLTAARRVVRFFNIDMNGGGLITVETQQAVETLDKYVRIATKEEKQDANHIDRNGSSSPIRTEDVP